MIIKKGTLSDKGSLDELTAYSNTTDGTEDKEVNSIIQKAWDECRKITSEKRKNCTVICKKKNIVFALPFSDRRGTALLQKAEKFCVDNSIDQYVIFKHTGIQQAQFLYGMALSRKEEWR